jgi:hypothetical protein
MFLTHSAQALAATLTNLKEDPRKDSFNFAYQVLDPL